MCSEGYWDCIFLGLCESQGDFGVVGSDNKGLWPPTAAAAAAAESLQSCLTLCDPTDGSPPGSPSLGFSRQEHWIGLPFPCPMHES